MTKIIRKIDIAVREIVEGNVIALPTETVYGLGANALNENAVIKIFEAKERPRFNPLIVHILDVEELEKYGMDIPQEVYFLAEKFSPGPITYVVKKKNIIPDIVTSGNDSVGLRIPAHPIFREVLKDSGVPVSAPSANRFGKISPTSPEDVLKELDGRIDYILDGGKCSIGIESTVVSFIDDEIKIVRHGFITKEEIENVVGKVWEKQYDKIISPGLLKSHYSPSTPLYFTEDINGIKKLSDKGIGILEFSKYKDKKEIALNLFSDLRNLDEMNFDMIVCEGVEDEGLGMAINERLEKASSGFAQSINCQLSIRRSAAAEDQLSIF